MMAAVDPDDSSNAVRWVEFADGTTMDAENLKLGNGKDEPDDDEALHSRLFEYSLQLESLADFARSGISDGDSNQVLRVIKGDMMRLSNSLRKAAAESLTISEKAVVEALRKAQAADQEATT